MEKFPVLTDAERQECIANLRAFMEADRKVRGILAEQKKIKEDELNNLNKK